MSKQLLFNTKTKLSKHTIFNSELLFYFSYNKFQENLENVSILYLHASF